MKLTLYWIRDTYPIGCSSELHSSRSCCYKFGFPGPTIYILVLSFGRVVCKAPSKKHICALLSALVKFQKAQCFFFLAVETAAQIVISRSLLQARNLQQLYDNYALIGAVAISGLLPISFILLCVHRFRMKFWYIFILSTCTITLSAGTLYTTNYANADPKPESTATDDAGCGEIDPSIFCLTKAENDSITMVGLGGGPVALLSLWPHYCSLSLTNMT